MSRLSEWQEARKKHGWFNRRDINSSIDPKIKKIRAAYPLETHLDLDERLFPGPWDSFGEGLHQARNMSNDKLRNILIKQDITPRTVGLFTEYMFRETVDQEILDKYKNINIDNYLAFIKRRMAEANSAETLSAIGNFGAFGISLGAGFALNRMASNSENITPFIDFIKKKDNIDTTVNVIDDTLFSRFSQSKNLASVGKDLAIAGHELGHAKNYAQLSKYFGKAAPIISTVTYNGLGDIPFIGRVFGKSIGGVPLLGLAAIPFADRRFTNKLKSDDRHSMQNKAVDYIERHPLQLGALAVSPKLIEEGSATVRALNNLGRYSGAASALKGSPKLLTAFATYLAAAALPVLAINFINKKTKGTQQAQTYLRNRIVN
ncbi:MAG TPA: hypothetical protein PKN48_00920 [Bacteroidales bacterium]|nr:hypothetical protein [Bacteroidales bacterium]